MKKLYLCNFTIVYHDYPDSVDREPNQMRLVRAEDEKKALAALRADVEVHDPYGLSKRIEDCSIHEEIGG